MFMRIIWLAVAGLLPLTALASSDIGISCDSYLSHESWADGDKSRPGSQCKKYELIQGPIASKYPDGSVIPNPHFLSKMRRTSRSAVPSKERAQLEKAILPSAAKKKSIQDTLTRLQRIYSDRVEAMPDSPQKSLLIERLKQMKLSFVNDSVQCQNALIPTAYTEPAKNLIELCEAGLGFPIEALVPVLAHEIAHLMDPCTQEVFPYVAEKMKVLKRNGSAALEECGLSLEKDFPLEESDLKSVVMEFESGARGVLPTLDSQPFIQSLMKCGILKTPDLIKKQDLENHPFREFHQCSSKYASDAETSQTSTTSSSPTTNEIAPISYSASKSCKTKSKECFADHLGAEMTDTYMLKHPQHMRPDASKEMLAVFTGDACEYGNYEGRSYPSSNKRTGAFLQYPRIQAALQCKGMSATPICPIKDKNHSSTSKVRPAVK